MQTTHYATILIVHTTLTRHTTRCYTLHVHDATHYTMLHTTTCTRCYTLHDATHYYNSLQCYTTRRCTLHDARHYTMLHGTQGYTLHTYTTIHTTYATLHVTLCYTLRNATQHMCTRLDTTRRYTARKEKRLHSTVKWKAMIAALHHA